MEKHHSEFMDKRPLYSASFARKSKAIGVLWGVFTVCFAIIIIYIFIQPHWIGDTTLSKSAGSFGLWNRCTAHSTGSDKVPCIGDLQDFESIPSMAFKAATILVGLAMAASLICIISLLFFICISHSIVYNIAGFLQLLSALLLLVGVCIYPLGFDSHEVARVCGSTARAYNLGQCEVRWAYLLAILGVLDTAGLSALAFLLGSRTKKLKQQIRMQQQPPSNEPIYGGSMYKGGHMNPEFIHDGMSLTGSRKSLNLQPVMMMPRPDHETYSDYSHPRSKTPAIRAHYAAPNQNFQL